LQNKKFTSWTPPKVFLLLLFSSFPEKERKNEKLLNIKVQYTPVAGKKVLRAHGYAQYGSFLCVCTRRKYFHGCDPNHTFSHSLTVHILNARFSHIFPEWHYPENFLSLRSRKNSTNTDTKKFEVFLYKCALYKEKKKQTMTKKPLPTPSQIFPTNSYSTRRREAKTESVFPVNAGDVCENLHAYEFE
jgi:hypothetical protein